MSNCAKWLTSGLSLEKKGGERENFLFRGEQNIQKGRSIGFRFVNCGFVMDTLQHKYLEMFKDVAQQGFLVVLKGFKYNAAA